MASLRTGAPKAIAGLTVGSVVDYSDGAPMPVINPLPGNPAQMLPPTDMLEWRLEGGSRVLVRPSGTEPKLKAYCFAKGVSEDEAKTAVASLSDGTRDLLAISARM